MTRCEIIKDFIIKSICPVLFAMLLYNMFIHLCIQNGVTNYFLLWILCGIPFGIGKMFFLPIGGNMNFSIAMIIGNFVIGGLIGGVVLLWRLATAVYYIPLTVIRFIAARNTALYQ